MSESDVTRCPHRLMRLMQAFVVDEAQSALRHSMRNKLAAIRNSVYYVQRKVTNEVVAKEDPRVPEFLALIDTELTSCQALLRNRAMVADPAADARADVNGALAELLADEPIRGAVTLNGVPNAVARVDANELQVAVFCLLENAVDAQASDAPVELSVELAAGKVKISVSDRGHGLSTEARACLAPYFTTRAGRQGLGLNVAQRVATRHGGALALGAREGGGARATLELPSGSAI